MSIALEELRAAIAAHGVVARVVVVDLKGSVPREVGASMLIWQDGQSGTIGGGQLEYEATATARKALPGGDWLRRFSLGPELGQCCGGAVTLAAEIFDADRITTLTESHYLRRISGAMERPLSMDRAIAIHRNSGAVIDVQLADGWLLEPLLSSSLPLWIYGAGHVGRALVSVMAALPQFSITWVDDAQNRFPETIPENVTVFLSANLPDAAHHSPPAARHLIVTYSHSIDLELCHRLLGQEFTGIGLIGSKTKWARFRSRLKQLGHSVAQIDRIDCPIGQPELGKHPQAIAVGVAAKLLSVSGKRESVRDSVGEDRGSIAAKR